MNSKLTALTKMYIDVPHSNFSTTVRVHVAINDNPYDGIVPCVMTS